jgi:hypothetical protein
MTTVGFIKDAIATVLFLISASVIHRIPVNIITIGLLMGATIDGLFTLNPGWHCQKWNPWTVPGAVLGAQVAGFLLLLSHSI